MLSAIEQNDTVVFDLIKAEQARQGISIRMIPSENYVSRAVMQASSSCLTNKYAEGYPGRRYYEGQQVTDLIEILARKRATELFKADHANVQPYSGSVANLAAYSALMILPPTSAQSFLMVSAAVYSTVTDRDAIVTLSSSGSVSKASEILRL